MFQGKNFTLSDKFTVSEWEDRIDFKHGYSTASLKKEDLPQMIEILQGMLPEEELVTPPEEKPPSFSEGG